MGNLTALRVKTETKIGSHADGDGLYLKVQASSDPSKPNKSWIYRWGANGAKSMGLGSVSDVTLAQARELAAEARRQYKQGKDPRVERERAKAAMNKPQAATFAQVAANFINVQKVGWKSRKHAEQWTNTLTTYAFPVIGHKACSDITRDDVLKILQPIWTEKHETATRLRGRIEAIWSSAEEAGLCNGKNPAQLKGNLLGSLPKISKARRTKHHPTMPYADVPRFMSNLKQDPTVSAQALALCILTATRTGELIGAQWNEIDLQSKCWNIPAERMKMHRAHRVPLSDAAISVLESLTKTGDAGEFVFKGQGKATKHLSNMAMLAYLKGRDEYKNLTVHGFRSSFRDWAGEQTQHTREVIEHALAHKLADQAEAAYQRGDYFQKRITLMQDWANFCLGKK